MRLLLSFFIAFFIAVSATPSVHIEEVPTLVNGWTVSREALGVSTVSFRILAKEQNLDVLAEIAQKVSDPSHPEYTNYLTREKLDDLTRPSKDDIAVIRRWLATFSSAQISIFRNRVFDVTLPVADAEALLSTTFRTLVNTVTGQRTVRASTYAIPSSVKASISAIFKLHGLPLPPKKQPQLPTADPASVTPDVIISTYGIAGVTVQKSAGNRQAVAEFQGQTMDPSDLVKFFSQYVKNAAPGDDVISKFVGDKGDSGGQVEASLDTQYIMGVAPGIPTEFWLWDPSDFCADLFDWTETILNTTGAPYVFSVSYGWQGDVTQVGCKRSEELAVDNDLSKIVALGISIIFASGDSGSGYAPSPGNCQSTNYMPTTALTGTLQQTVQAQEVDECCDISAQLNGQGWTFTGGSGPPPNPVKECQTNPPAHDTALQGTVYQKLSVSQQLECCEISYQIGVGYNFNASARSDQCVIFRTVTGTTPAPGIESHQNPRQQLTECMIYSKVTGKNVNSSCTSGTQGASKVTLYPSWPASSPWVTAVGATRFIDQTVGQPEMATDQFGSGGGFSEDFTQVPNATWQQSAVANYLTVVPKGAPFPPAGSFPPGGRATPDVSALGEGFQVYNGGQLMAVGGTSASAPTFAAIVSLLNEARLQAGKKPLGFLNPWIYKNAAAFTDVTVGTNAIGRGTGPLPYGFNCTVGWDPATGFGTPNFKNLLAAAMSAP